MAGGNLGDLSFSLTLQSRIEQEAKGIIQALNNVDATGKRAQEALDAITTAATGMGSKGQSGVEKMIRCFQELEREIAKVQSEEDVDVRLLKKLNQAYTAYQRINDIIKEIRASGGITTNIDVGAQRVEEILQQRRHAREQEAKREAEIEDARQRKMQQSAQIAQETYSQEIKASREKAAAFAADIRRQMEEEMRLRQLRMTAPVGQLRSSFRKYYDIDTMSRPLTPTLNANGINDIQKAYGQAFDELQKKAEALQSKLANYSGPETGWVTKTKSELADLERQMQGLITLSQKASAQLGNTYTPKIGTSAQDEAAMARRRDEIRKTYEEHFANEKKLREEQQRTQKEQEEAAARARANVDKVQRRYEQLFDTLQKMRSARNDANALGLDTTKIDAQIQGVIQSLKELRSWRNEALKNLGMGSDMRSFAIGSKDFSVDRSMSSGLSARAVELLNRQTAEQQKLNNEKRASIEAERKHQQEVAATANKVRGELVSAFEQARKSANGMNSTLQDLKSLFLQGGLVYGAKSFLDSIVQTGGEMEKQHIALQSIIGDMQNADILFNQVKDLALKSPFTFSELNRDVKQLAAYGTEYDQLYDTTKRLADMSAGLGVSFERIALAFGQVQARGWLDGKELRQISYAGIPILKKLSEYYSQREGQKVSTSDVKSRISNREVDFADVKKIFWDMTDAGGEFYNMQETLSETLLGKFNKLKDAWEIMLAGFARGDSVVGGSLKDITSLVTALVQNIDKIGPALIGIFGAVGMSKAKNAIAGTLGANLLGAKGQIGADVAKQVMQGKQISGIQRSILATKNRITNADLRTLAYAGAITKQDLQRMYIEGKITPQIYKQQMAVQMLSQGMTKAEVRAAMLGTQMRLATSGSGWQQFLAKGSMAMSLLGAQGKVLGAQLMAAVGGIPGLLMAGLTAGIMYLWNESEELTQAIKQSQDELENRKKQIGEFLKKNNVSDTISSGDEKAIDNMIDEYKDKLEELSPSMSQFFIMNANEKKSHEERLRYLQDEMKAQQEANKTAQRKLADRDTFDDLKSYFESSKKQMEPLAELKAKAYAWNASEKDRREYGNASVHAYNNAYELAQQFARILPDVGSNPVTQRAAVQMFDNMLSQVEIPEDSADLLRASVMKALGISDAWLQTQVGKKMQELMSDTSSEIADKIRNNIELTDAEKKKVQELMEDARKNLSTEYPAFKDELQKLLDASNFQAIIKLVYSMDEAPDMLENQVMRNILGGKGPLKDASKYTGPAKRWVKAANNDPYAAVNAAHQDIDAAYNSLKRWNKMLAKGKATQKEVNKAEQKYKDLVTANQEAFGDFYTGEDKKSNKQKGNKGRQEDKELKNRQERLSSLKSARQMYQKYQKIMSDNAAKSKTYKLFPEVKDLDLDRYEESVKKIFEKFDFGKSEERRKFRTSLYREIAEWLYSEEDKKEYDRKAAEFSESLNRLAERWDLYKDLLEKTGDEDYANGAFYDRYLVDEKVKNLMVDYKNKYKKDFGLQDAMQMTDGEARETLRGSGEYEAWKKITDLLRGNYIEALRNGADITKETMGYDEQIAAIQEKYNRLIREQNELGNSRAARSYEMQRDKEVGSVNYKRLTDSVDYAKFFATTIRQSGTELKKYAGFLKKELSKALKEGAITAEEYSEKINDINKRMSGIDSGAGQFLGGGLNGLADGLKKMGENRQKEGNSIYDKAQEAYNKAKAANDIKGMADADNAMKAGQSMADGGAELMQGAGQMQGAISTIDKIIHGINDLVQGMNDTFQDIKETAQALGHDTSTDDWSDANTFFTSFSNASDSATKGWDSLKEGNMGGVISGVVGSWTGWIKGYAQGHDQKLENQIQIAERQLKILQNISDNVSKVIQNTLGGVYRYKMTKYTEDNLKQMTDDYEERKRLQAQLNGVESTSSSMLKGGAKGSTIGGIAGGWVGAIAGGLIGGLTGLFGSKKKKLRAKINALPDYSDDTYEQTKKALQTGEAYDAQLASLMAQRDQLQNKRDAENGKKNKDKSKIADYDKQIEDARQEIENFTQTWLKDVYDVDLKSWASQLTDAIVDAWAKGEDAADAYHDTVAELMKDLSKKIISQSIMEARLQPVLDKYSELLKKNSGKLGQEDLSSIWDLMMEQQQGAIDDTYDFLDYAKAHGVDLSENGSLSTSNSIKSITEETADLLASYINAIRLDVSVNRENVLKIALAVEKLPQLNVIAQAQLTQLNALVNLAQARNDRLDQMYDWMRATTNGTKKISVA